MTTTDFEQIRQAVFVMLDYEERNDLLFMTTRERRELQANLKQIIDFSEEKMRQSEE